MKNQEVVQKEKEMAEITERIEKLGVQSGKLHEDLEKLNVQLAEDNKANKYTENLQGDIARLKAEKLKVEELIGSESQKYAKLHREVISAQIDRVDAEVKGIQVDYEKKVEEIVQSLAELWEHSVAMRDLYNKSTKLCFDFNTSNPLYFSSLTVNNLTLFQSAHFYLRKMEEVFPEICKRVKHESYEKRFDVICPRE
jgi:chromosome segregation ATPase